MDSKSLKVVDYGYVIPGQKIKLTAEEREGVKQAFDELKKIAIESGVAFLIVKGDVK